MPSFPRHPGIPAQAEISLFSHGYKMISVSQSPDQIAFKVLTLLEFAALQNATFAGAPVDQADGYIHLSTAAQLTETVKKHFTGRTDLIIASVDLAALGDAIRWEASRNGALFPHLYGRLLPDHVIAHCPLAWAPDGSIRLP
jgi:uncharacterized protein (DUF952 family)